MSVAAVGAAIGGAAVTSLIAGNASKKAAKTQAKSADAQMQLQADMFNRTDDVQRRLYKAQRDTINANTDKSLGAATSGFHSAKNQALQLYNRGMDTAAETRDLNTGLNKNALRASAARSRDAMYDTYRENNATYARGMGQAKNALDANLGTYGKEKDASLAYFEPSIGRGDDAGAAYAYNLGLGGKPTGYSGLQESEGTKYLMKTGRQEIEGGAAARGNLNSGATLAALEEKRQGLASLDKDNQMAQLMALAGLGQGAANSAAGIRAGYADDVAGVRNSYRDAALGLDQTRNAGNTDARNLGTATLNALQDTYANRGIGINNAWNANSYAIGSDKANALTGAADTLAQRRMASWDLNTANLGAARNSRANLYGTAAGNYTAGLSSAIANKSDARAAGTIGSANALLGGMQNGFSIYGMLNGQREKTPSVPANGTDVFSNSSNPFSGFKWPWS